MTMVLAIVRDPASMDMLKDNVRDRHSFPWLEKLDGKLHSLACDAGLIVRRTRSFSGEGFLLAMLKAVCSGNASFNRIACLLSQSETRAMSRQALHSRIKEEAVEFLDAVLDHIVSHRIAPLVSAEERIFRRILVQDSTQLKMHRANHRVYPALDNHSGRTAGVKIDMRLDAMSGLPLSPRQSPARALSRNLQLRSGFPAHTQSLHWRDAEVALEGFNVLRRHQN